jgi:hypothetical protein
MLGVLHGIYGAGAVMNPLVATSIIAKDGLPWYYFYCHGKCLDLERFLTGIDHELMVRPHVRPSNW